MDSYVEKDGAQRTRRKAAARTNTAVRDKTVKTPTGKTTTRIELLEAVYLACPSLSRVQAREIFEMTLDEIAETLVRGEAVKLRSFGAFSVRSKRERIGRNPRTGEEATITPRRVLTFKASPVLNAKVNGETHEDEDE